MIHKLYKVAGKVNGLRGRFRFENNESVWLLKREADNAIACGSGVAVRCRGECAPYFAVLEYNAPPGNHPHPQNYSRAKNWSPPQNHTIIGSQEYNEKYGGGKKGGSQQPPQANERSVDLLAKSEPSNIPSEPHKSVGQDDVSVPVTHKRGPGRPRKEESDV